MIRFILQPEPEEFDERVRQRGQRWLKEHDEQSARPPAYWNDFRVEICRAFRNLCAYSVMHLPTHGGQVDHFVSADEDRDLMYEWRNYRWSAGSINSSKKALRAHQLIDPCEVGDDWFEVLLPSLELDLTDRCPPEHHERARTMLDRLGLRRDRQVLSTRQAWYEQFLVGEIALGGLDRNAPMLAGAVRKRLMRIEIGAAEEPEPLCRFLEGAMGLRELRRQMPSLAQRVEALLRLPPDCVR